MTAINLLPKDLTPKEGVLKTSRLLRRIGIIGYVSLIVATVAFVGGFLFVSRQLDDSKENQGRLKQGIAALKNTEIRLVLIKDRIKKAEQVLKTPSAESELEDFSSFLNSFPAGVIIEDAVLSSNYSEVTVIAGSSSALVTFFAELIASGIYSNISMEDFEFNQLIGYKVVLKLAG